MNIGRRNALLIVLVSAVTLGICNLFFWILVPPHDLVPTVLLTLGTFCEASMASIWIWTAPKDF